MKPLARILAELRHFDCTTDALAIRLGIDAGIVAAILGHEASADPPPVSRRALAGTTVTVWRLTDFGRSATYLPSS